MTTITALTSYGITSDLNALIFGGSIIARTPTQLVVRKGAYDIRFVSADGGLEYAPTGSPNAGAITAGSFERIEVVQSGFLSARFEGFSTTSAPFLYDVISNGLTTLGTSLTFFELAGGTTFTGNAGADTFTGGSAADFVNGGAGNDSLSGGAFDDTLIGGLGNDVLRGEAGRDLIFGGDGNDTIYASADIDFVNGGAGIDTIDYSQLGTGVIVQLFSNSDIIGTFVIQIENIIGSPQEMNSSAMSWRTRSVAGSATIPCAALSELTSSTAATGSIPPTTPAPRSESPST